VAQDPEEEETQTVGEQSDPRPTTETTRLQDADALSEITHPTEEVTLAELRNRLDQTASDAFGATIHVTESQLRGFLAQLVAAKPTPSAVGDSHPFPKRTRGGPPDDDSSENPSDHGSDRGSRRPRRQMPRSPLRDDTPFLGVKRSPKHNDPGQLDDGTSPTYTAWCILLEDKLENNADWWPTERARIGYVFSQTKGRAQKQLLPRMNRKSPDRWQSVDEMLDHLDLGFRDHFEKEKAADQYARHRQQAGEDFNDFHSEFSRLATTGEIPPSVWRADLYRKLNRTFQDRLMSTEHLYPTYPGLVLACQRINVRILEYRRQFPGQEPTTGQRYRPSTIKAAVAGDSAPPRPRQGLLPAPKYSAATFRPAPSPDKRDSATPGPRDSPARETDPTKATCFNCGEVGHFQSSCTNPRSTPRIHEIRQDAEFFSGDDEANDEADPGDSESEN
jgi:hypothetical protein